jgi:hypothetical protein
MVSDPGDPEEQQADRMADRVMRSHAGVAGSSPCSCAEDGEMCDECRQEQGTIARQSEGARNPPASAGMLRGVLRSPGQPMDSATCGFFEPRFGRDFSDVRIHTEDTAAHSAAAIDALAYAAGSDIVFASGV